VPVCVPVPVPECFQSILYADISYCCQELFSLNSKSGTGTHTGTGTNFEDQASLLKKIHSHAHKIADEGREADFP